MDIAIVPDDPKRCVVAQYGKFVVWYDPLPHRPYGLFRIYCGDKYVGAQISWPIESDCDWHYRRSGVYATETRWLSYSRGRRGRPRKADAERELQEAIAA